MATERLFDPSDGMTFVVRLLNSWDELEPDPELLRDPSVGARFLRRHGFDDAAARMDEAELAALKALRGRLQAAWDAPDDEDAVVLLNELAAGGAAHRTLARTWSTIFRVPGPVSSAAKTTSACSAVCSIRRHCSA